MTLYKTGSNSTPGPVAKLLHRCRVGGYQDVERQKNKRAGEKATRRNAIRPQIVLHNAPLTD